METEHPDNTSTPKHNLFIWLAIIATWGLLTWIYLAVSILAGDALFDFDAYYQAAERLNTGTPLYFSVQGLKTYLYPPLLAQMLTPLQTTFAFSEAAVIWFIINMGCLLLSIGLLSHQMPTRKKQYIVWFLPFIFLFSVESFTHGQIVPIMLGLITVTMVAFKQKQFAVAGICIAVATWLKIYPIFIIFYFIYRREWNAVMWSFVFGMVLLLLQIAISGIDVLMIYFTDTLLDLAANGQTLLLYRNHSIYGFAHRLFIDTPTIAKLIQWVITCIMVIVMGYVFSREIKTSGKNHDNRFELEYAMIIIFMLLMGSTLLSSSLLPIILPIAIGLKHATKMIDYGVFVLACFGIGLTFAYVSGELILLTSHPLVQSYGFFGQVILWALLGYLHIKLLSVEPIS